MKKIVLVFDLDYTLFYSDNALEVEWTGAKELWLDLCHRLKNFALKYNVELNFAIATAKDWIDDLVEEAVSALSDYLFAFDTTNYLQVPVIKHGWLQVDHANVPTMFHVPTYDYIQNTESAMISWHTDKYGPQIRFIKKNCRFIRGD